MKKKITAACIAVLLSQCVTYCASNNEMSSQLDKAVDRLNAFHDTEFTTIPDWNIFSELVKSVVNAGVDQIREGSEQRERDVVSSDNRIGGDHYKAARELFKRMAAIFDRLDGNQSVKENIIYKKCRGDFYKIYGWFEFKTSIRKMDSLRALQIITDTLRRDENDADLWYEIALAYSNLKTNYGKIFIEGREVRDNDVIKALLKAISIDATLGLPQALLAEYEPDPTQSGEYLYEGLKNMKKTERSLFFALFDETRWQKYKERTKHHLKISQPELFEHYLSGK